MNRETLTTILALVVAGVWATTALASLFIRDYTAISVVTPVMLIVAGFMFGVRVTKKTSTNGTDGD